MRERADSLVYLLGVWKIETAAQIGRYLSVAERNDGFRSGPWWFRKELHGNPYQDYCLYWITASVSCWYVLHWLLTVLAFLVHRMISVARNHGS